jgi:hypothetical protein
MCSVNQRRRLQGMSRLLDGQLMRRQPAQLGVDQRHELLRARRIALLNGRQNVGHIAHCPVHRGLNELPLRGRRFTLTHAWLGPDNAHTIGARRGCMFNPFSEIAKS